MGENNNPFDNLNNENTEKPVGSDVPENDNGQAQSEHTGYEQPGDQQTKEQTQNQPAEGSQQGYQQQGYSQNNQGQYQQNYQQPGQYQQNYSQNQQYNQNPYNNQQYNQNPYNNQYNQNPYSTGYQTSYQQPKTNNSMAVASLVCGIVSLLISCCWFISLPLSIVSVVLGIIVLRQKKDGRSLAIIGIIIGAATIIICIILVAFYAYMFTGNSEFSNYYKQFYNEIYNDVESSVY